MALDRYRLALRAPGVGRLLATSLVARMPNGMSSLAILLLVTRHHGYGRAGVVTGLYVAASGASNLLLARAADRYGARRVVVPAAFGYAAGMTLLATATGGRYGAQLLAATLTGLFNPPVVSVVRGLWPRVLEPEIAQIVYGLEATAQELVFISGPALVALVAGLAGASAAVALTGVLALVGTLAFATAPLLAQVRPAGERMRHRLLRTTRLPVYLAVGVAVTIAFNMADVGIVAFVSGRHASAGSGVVLAVWSLGSMLGGLWFGAATGRVDESAVGRAVALIAVAIAVAAAAPGPIGLGVIMFVGGATIAPGLARLYARVGALAPEGAETEAFGWMAVALMVGSSLGAAVGGLTVQALGPRVDFLLAAAAPALVAAALWPSVRSCTAPGTAHEPLPS
ncbi:MAG TPA: MFS transporter [Mycobacteriales bacterium]|nr:MFS transporter [Mycobacteriales bacterium]